MNYKILEHTADVGFEAYGESREEVLANASEALVSLITDPEKIKGKDRKEFGVCGDDWGHLLVRYLNEILYIIDAGSFYPARTEVTIAENFSVKAVMWGETRNTSHEVRTDVKAVTYHQLIFDETPEGFYIRIFVDI